MDQHGIHYTLNMNDIRYAFVELETDESFVKFGRAFRGTFQSNSLCFDNPVVKGVIIRRMPEPGLWIRKWKLTVFEKITLHREAAPFIAEKKFSIIYLLNPSIFDLRNSQQKKVSVKNHGTALFVSNRAAMDFSVVPKQPFYVLDITFNDAWLMKQFEDCDLEFRCALQDYLSTAVKSILMQPCQPVEYKILHELDVSSNEEWKNELYIRSRVYQLLSAFFKKLIVNDELKGEKKIYHYEQIVQTEAMLMNNLKSAPKIDEIAKSINLSSSSLLREFKLMYGKNLQDYYLEKKMELAKKLILEKKITVKKVAELLGYRQTSAFIQAFTKQFHCSPGNLK